MVMKGDHRSTGGIALLSFARNPRVVPNNSVFTLPPVIAALRAAQQAVVRHYAHTELTFTLDGKLVGDIGEAIALEYFDVEQERNLQGKLVRRKGIDAVVRGGGATVQVKTTGSTGAGPAFSRGDTPADLLLFFRIDWQACTATVIYNGPEAPIRACLKAPARQGTASVTLNEVLRIGSTITDPRMRVPLRSRVVANAIEEPGWPAARSHHRARAAL